jgi:hypothetical protein
MATAIRRSRQIIQREEDETGDMMKVRKGAIVKYQKQMVRVLDLSDNKKTAWIGLSVPVSKLRKVI